MAGLGKGLEALLSGKTNTHEHLSESNHKIQETTNSTCMININLLQRGQFQPRREIDIDSENLAGLAESIANQGIIEPIIVRLIGNDKYEIIAGERRWRAALKAGLNEVPCIIREFSDEESMVIALLENIQREDLNVIEEAQAYNLLCSRLSLTHTALADKLGKSRPYVSNIIRLNDLCEEVKELLRRGELEMGHARALLSLDKKIQLEVALTIVQKGLTVRDTEQLVSKILTPAKTKEHVISPEVSMVTENLKSKLGDLDFKYTNNGKDKGKLILNFKNQAELNKIKEILGI